MSYYREHHYTADKRAVLMPARAADSYAVVVGTVDTGSERPITGRNGDHLQFFLNLGDGTRYQVDVNTQSSDGSEIGAYSAIETLTPAGATADQPFGPPAYGVSADAALSYAGMGLTDNDFTPIAYYRIESQLTAALNGSAFVSAYGMNFDDGGPDGKGVHDIHFNTGRTQQDGALAVYMLVNGTPQRMWFFFKFQNDQIRS